MSRITIRVLLLVLVAVLVSTATYGLLQDMPAFGLFYVGAAISGFFYEWLH